MGIEIHNNFHRLAVQFCVPFLLCISTAATDKPNVVLFLVDDLGWSDVGSYGSKAYETPNIDRMADSGVRFTNAYAACHVCSPTRASIMTGKYPARLGLTDWIPGRRNFPFQQLKNASNLQQLPLKEVTLAETLKTHGYTTGHFGKWHLGENEFGPLSQGFDVQIPRNWFKGWPKSGYYSPFEMEGIRDSSQGYLTDRLTDEALRFIDENHKKPFFVYLSHFAVHDPIHGRSDLTSKYRTKARSGKNSGESEFILEGNPDESNPLGRTQLEELIKKRSHSQFRVLPQRTVKIKQRQDNVEFASMVEAMDESLGRIVSKLEKLNLTQNTIIVFFSDNGGMSGMNVGNPLRRVGRSSLDKAFSTSNLPLRGGKGWLYEGGIRVPCIIKWPGKIDAARVSNECVISNDIYPTILELANLPALPEQTIDGVSMVPTFSGDNIKRRSIYWHFPHYSNHGMQSPGGAIREGRYKLIEYFEKGNVQLFDLHSDIGEQKDLSKVMPERATQMLRKLKDWRKRVGARTMASNPAYDPTKYPWKEAK